MCTHPIDALIHTSTHAPSKHVYAYLYLTHNMAFSACNQEVNEQLKSTGNTNKPV